MNEQQIKANELFATYTRIMSHGSRTHPRWYVYVPLVDDPYTERVMGVVKCWDNLKETEAFYYGSYEQAIADLNGKIDKFRADMKAQHNGDLINARRWLKELETKGDDYDFLNDIVTQSFAHP